MAWRTPKTNWAATDYFNYSDYARIVGNITYLRTLHNTVFVNITLESVPSSKSYTALLYASEMNAIENNLEALNVNSYDLNIGDKKQYRINGPTPDYEELNRIESATLRLYNFYNAQIDSKPHLAVRLGGDKMFNVARNSI